MTCCGVVGLGMGLKLELKLQNERELFAVQENEEFHKNLPLEIVQRLLGKDELCPKRGKLSQNFISIQVHKRDIYHNNTMYQHECITTQQQTLKTHKEP